MTDYELTKFCEAHLECDCNCMRCQAFAANMRHELGYDERDDEDDGDDE